ncbi:hypothetical protein [Geodermatophilus sp. SYSU D01036]
MNPFRHATVQGIEVELPSGAVRRYEDRFDLSPADDGGWELSAHTFTWDRDGTGSVVVRETVREWALADPADAVAAVETEPAGTEQRDVSVFRASGLLRLETYLLLDAAVWDPLYQGWDPAEGLELRRAG